MGEEFERLEAPVVSNVVEALPAGLRQVFIEVIGEHDADLLKSLQARSESDAGQRRAVEELLADEFDNNLGPDWEPTQRGRIINDAIEAFLLRWPITDD